MRWEAGTLSDIFARSPTISAEHFAELAACVLLVSHPCKKPFHSVALKSIIWVEITQRMEQQEIRW